MSRMLYPQMAKREDEGLANAFTSFTSLIGLGKYFTSNPVVEMSNNPIVDTAAGRDQKINHSSLYN